jgi:hypothetical protein
LILKASHGNATKWDVGHTEMLFDKKDAEAPVVGPVKTDEVLREPGSVC